MSACTWVTDLPNDQWTKHGPSLHSECTRNTHWQCMEKLRERERSDSDYSREWCSARQRRKEAHQNAISDHLPLCSLKLKAYVSSLLAIVLGNACPYVCDVALFIINKGARQHIEQAVREWQWMREIKRIERYAHIRGSSWFVERNFVGKFSSTQGVKPNAINGNVVALELEGNSNHVVVLPRNINIVRKHVI